MKKKSSKTIHNEISSDDELSYSNLNDKYLVKIIKQFTPIDLYLVYQFLSLVYFS